MKPLLFVFLSFFIMLEIGLRAVDPLAIREHQRDSIQFSSIRIDHDVLPHLLADGDHVFTDWTATIHNGYRVTPASRNHACVIAFIGDSHTFGQSVSNSDVWVNLLAGELNAHVINAGIPGYELDAIVERMRLTPADGYVYLQTANDALPQGLNAFAGRHSWSAIHTYVNWFTYDAPAITPVMQATLEARLIELERDGVLVIRPDSVRFENFRSWADGHRNAVGNAQLADDVRERVQGYVSEVCE